MFVAPRERLAPDAATLARAFLALVPEEGALAARVEALPRVAVVPRVHPDWDAVIADGEDALAGPVDDWARAYFELPLAAAYHQRACRAWAAGDRAAALADAQRAATLDAVWLPYQTTRALCLDAAGRVAEGAQALDEALGRPPPADSTFDRLPDPGPAEQARARAARGSIALHLDLPAEAAEHLRRAVDLAPGDDARARYTRLLDHALRRAGPR
jgi:tetratricopeptide (TPR) repeat protein